MAGHPMEEDDILVGIDAALKSGSLVLSSCQTTPPNSSSATQPTFGSTFVHNPTDAVESSPQRRIDAYNAMCRGILSSVAHEESRRNDDDDDDDDDDNSDNSDNSDYTKLAQTLAKLFTRRNHAANRAEQFGFLELRLSTLLDNDRHPLLRVVRRHLEATCQDLPASIVNCLMHSVPATHPRYQAQLEMNPVQPQRIIFERIKRHLSHKSHPPQHDVDRLDLFLRCTFVPERHVNPDAAESNLIVKSAFKVPFQGPAVDRLLLFLAVLSAHSFTSRRPAQTSSSAATTTRAMDTTCSAMTTTPAVAQASSDSASSASSPDKNEPQLGHAQLSSLPYYARVVPILQSSGFGKSKLCVHLSVRQPGMLICLRDHHPNQASASSFPPQDISTYNYFKATLDPATNTPSDLLTDQRHHTHKQPLASDRSSTATDEARSHRIHARLACFLGAYCQTLHLHLKNLMLLSTCFTDASGSSSVRIPVAQHSDPFCCWQTIVYALSVCLHRKSSFLEDIELTPPDRLCSRALEVLVSYGILELSMFPPSQTNSSAFNTRAPSSASPSMELAAFLGRLKGHETRNEFLDEVITRAHNLFDQANGCVDPQSMATCVIRPHLDQLEILVGSKNFESAMFYLALDECGTIEDLLAHLRRLWNYAEPQRTWILLIDTNSKIAPVAGHVAIDGSFRIAASTGSFQLTPAFTSMPLDVMFKKDDSQRLADRLSNGTCTLRELNCIMYKLGRPLWNDVRSYRHNTGQNMGLPKCHGIVAKLVRDPQWRWPKEPPKAISDIKASDDDFQKIMALVSQRMPLGQHTSNMTQTWQTFVKNQVSNHLRFIERIYPYTDAIQSHVPSEPPLSVAAAWFFRSDDAQISTKWSLAVLSIVAARTVIGLSIGLEGEEGVQLLSTMASDFAASARYSEIYSKVDHQDTWFPEHDNDVYLATLGLITLDEWLTTLLGSNIVADQDSETDEETLKQWAKRQWMNFKHVGDLPWQLDVKTERMDRGLLAQFWIRHAAMRGVSNQPGWDLLIPIYESDLVPASDHFDLSRLSYVAIQVKNQVRAPDYPNVLGPDLSAMDAGKEHDDTIGCLELFLDLCGPLTSAHSLLSSSRMVSPNLKQIRHNIYASSLNETTFPVLGRLGNSARDAAPVVFGLSYLGTNQFDEDFARMVCEGEVEQRDEARRRLDVDAGKFPLIMGIPMQKKPSRDVRERARGFASGQTQRMRPLALK